MDRPPPTAPLSFRRRLVRPAASLLAVAAAAGPWTLGGAGAGWAVACGTAAAVALLVLVDRLHGALRDAEHEMLACREEAARHDAEWRAYCAAQDARREETVRHLAEVRFPAALAGEPVPAAQPPEGQEAVAHWHEKLLASGAQVLRNVREREESLRLVVVALSRRVQASSHRIQEEMAGMEARHPHNPDVAESGMRGDHAAAQQARIAQSLAVLCGEWPGQQWQKPHALVDVVRAGASRILSYQRVKVSGDQDIAAAATVVEPLVHVVAELLANATQCAPPTTHVEVSVRPVTRGAVIEIDDAGLGMDEYTLDRAREIVSGRRLLGFADLGEVPQTGLAVVGRYAERHDLKVDLMPSPYGGVRAVVLVPDAVLHTLEPAGVPASRQPEPDTGAAPAPDGAGSGAATDDGPGAYRPPLTPGGLPQRRSSRSLRPGTDPDGLDGTPEPAPPPPPPPSPEEAGAWMGALFAGSRAGQPADPGSGDRPTLPPGADASVPAPRAPALPDRASRTPEPGADSGSSDHPEGQM